MEPVDGEVITKRSLESQATDVLRARILDRQLPPGTRLVETDLAERHGLSRSTTRAALRRLIDEGLVRQEPYAGCRVIELSAHDLWELSTLRASLEGLAARLAAERIDETGARTLRDAYRALEAAARRGDHQEADRQDHELHLVIIRLSGHERLAQHHARVENQFRAHISLSNRNTTSAEIAQSHRALVDAICEGNPSEAELLAGANVEPPPEAERTDVEGADLR